MRLHPIWTIASVCALGLTLPASTAASEIPEGPAGNAFYDPPSPLSDGERGAVIYARGFDGTMALPSAARNTLVLYYSVSPDNELVPVSGTVSVPHGEPPEGGWPVITWSHGTTGLSRECAPSLDGPDGPEHGYVKAMQTFLDRYVANGYAVVATDYQGLGVAGAEAYLQGVPTGRNVLDMVTAGQQIEPDVGKRYAIMGHSQGGQVELFAAAMGPDYLPDHELVGNAAFAPASHFADRLEALVTTDEVEPALPYVLYILVSYAQTNEAIDLDRILTQEAISHLSELYDGCEAQALDLPYWSQAVASEQFVDNPDLEAYRAMADYNDPGNLEIAVPTIVFQGTDDHTVLPAGTDAVLRQMCANGNEVYYHPLPGADHRGAIVHGADPAFDWIEARFADESADSNCGDLPEAATN